MLVAIALVPPQDVSAAFETLENDVHESLDGLVSYFEENYIGKKLKRRRKGPHFFTSAGGMFMTELWRANRELITTPKQAFGGFKLNLAVHIQHCGRFIKGIRNNTFCAIWSIIKRQEGKLLPRKNQSLLPEKKAS